MGDWILVETLGDEPSVLSVGNRRRDWRRLRNEFRGPALKAVESLVAECRRTRDRVVRTNPVPALAVPVLGPGRFLAGVHVWVGSEGDQPPALPRVAVWDWDLGDSSKPPQLHLDTETIDLLGLKAQFRDRTVFGPGDFFTRVVRISDVLRLLRGVHVPAVDQHEQGGTSSEVVIRHDDGELRIIHFDQRTVKAESGIRLRALARDVTAERDISGLHIETADAELLLIATEMQDMFGAIGDLHWPDAPYFLKWITPHPKGMGGGVTSGGTSALHPDDWPQVIQWIGAVRQGPVTGTVRVRHASGGWMRARFSGQLLDSQISPSVGLALIYPDLENLDLADA